MSLENKGYYEIKKAPASGCKGYELGNRDTNDPTQPPEKQGYFDNGNSTSPQFSPQLNYFEQILTLFDELDGDEQERLLEALKERVKEYSR